MEKIFYIIRDNSCRKKVNKKREEWGSCNSMGFFRDDNSMVKGIPKKYKIQSKNKNYSGAKIGRGFVACHIWQKILDRPRLSTKNHLTNTFVPNLVWLPKQIAKLTDREGSFTQRYLQALSASVYRGAKMEPKKSKFVKNIWAKFPSTRKIAISRKEIKNLNFFLIDDDEVENKVGQLLKSIEMIKNPAKNKKLHCRRYFMTFSKLPKTNKDQFTRKLDRYAKIL